MGPKAIFNDFHYFVGTLLFGLFALVLVTAPNGGLTVAEALVRAGLSAVLLAASFYVLESREAARKATEPERRPVVVSVESHRRAARKSASNAA
jgi:hypothetical protein